MKKIVVVGAGYAGVLTAKRLEKKLRKNKIKDYEVTIINKNTYHTMLTELHEVAAGRVEEDSIRLELENIFAHRSVEVVVDEVLNIDFDNNKVKTKLTEYDYDYVIIGTGCKPTYYDVKGQEHIFPLWTYEDAVYLKEHIHDMFRKAKYEADVNERKKYLTFIIVGSGFTGVEMAGELAEYRKNLCFQYQIDESEITISIVEAGPRILSFYPDKLRNKVLKRFKKLNVEVFTNVTVCDVTSKICKFDETSLVDTYTVIWAAGIQGSTLIESLDKIDKTRMNRIDTNSYLQVTKYSNAYVVGDNINYIPKNAERPVPQMVENAEHSSKTVANNIISTIKGEALEEYEPQFSGSMVSVGSRWGVALIGKKDTQLSGFLAMFLKHLVNCIYFMEVLGFQKIWSYLKHEFFTVKHNRSIVGGHLSNAKSAPGIFLLPLRLFVGFMWLSSGVIKLPAIFDDWKNVFLMPPNPIDSMSSATGAPEAAEAVSSATGAAVEVAETTAEASQTFFDSLTAYTELSAGQTLPVPGFIQSMMNWMYEHIFWSDLGGFTTIAAVFQISIISLEIMIGLMLLAGLFTPLASILAVVVMLMIYSSGWSYISIVFFGLASLACFFAGNVLGLDYYVLPWLDKKLRSWKFTKKWYLYFKHE